MLYYRAFGGVMDSTAWICDTKCCVFIYKLTDELNFDSLVALQNTFSGNGIRDLPVETYGLIENSGDIGPYAYA